MTDIFLYLTLVFCLSFLPFTEQAVHRRHPQPLEAYGGHQAYYGNPSDPQPGKQVLNIDEQLHYYEPHHNNDGNGAYKRSPCPAVNTLANRGYIPRSGKRVSSQQILYAMREVWNFGDDNVSGPLVPGGQREPSSLDEKLTKNIATRASLSSILPTMSLIQMRHTSTWINSA